MFIDFSIKDLQSLQRIKTSLNLRLFDQINITEKTSQDWLLPLLSDLHPNICLHISAKNHQQHNINQYLQKAIECKINSFLIVSGLPRPAIDSIKLLQDLNHYPQIQISIAHTPFAKDQLKQRHRLLEKLKNSDISTVYLQIGDNLQKIKSETEFIKESCDCQIVGSILLPTPQLLNYFKHFKWSGVEYSQEYLGSIDCARAQTLEIYQHYQDYIDNILLEPFSAKPDQITDFYQFLIQNRCA
jgi:5,10-methylenetetrahydrofolate reductase